ncbi:Predicted DNA-binding protein with PD1-like DNA-binding motif [Tindallia magadiensis]|uniref:Predicted DNA-binding protein with PD1-like DNA-binding motif n=1 Tax=Tindallia magadiensis TaxID=69895 RepID=A0A1I3B140_9FIRM|nr:PPC domain-containing DNA-binding protein [Tindallia magadiensis]SFH55994.1 Predicted DNA-binding protein with PD1-like DNA-binding motif [Tindallia magadiensis]
MQYTEATQGRVFVLRLEQGDLLPDTIESFARHKGISSGVVYLLGATDQDSKIVSGPRDAESTRVPMDVNEHLLNDVYESFGFGTLFPDENKVPFLHLHAGFGRNKNALVGCIRPGVSIWLYMEVVIIELLNCTAKRKVNPDNGFTLLEID